MTRFPTSASNTRMAWFGAGLVAMAPLAISLAGPAAAHDKRYHSSKSYVVVEEDVVVDAPHTNVQVGKKTGRVAVDAPYTSVRVNPENRRVRVRAPYVNLDIRW